MSNILNYENISRRREKMISVPLTLDIYHWYQQMQQSHAVWFDESRASWLVFRYKEVQRVLLDSQTFSSQRVVDASGKVDPIRGGSILGMDPPRHNQLRALVSRVFTPRTVANLEAHIVAIVSSLLDQAAAKGEIDVVDDLAFPLPIMVIAALLGVSDSDRESFRQWSTDTGGIDSNLRMVAAQNITQYFRMMIKQRTQDPREDLISDILHAESDGEPLREEDIIGLCNVLLGAGHETVTGLISNSMVCFDEHPESLQRIIAQPDLLPSAIEEVLRYRAVVHTLARVATIDTELAGQEIKAGDLVLPLFASANLDEAQFPEAQTFDIERTPNRHLGFGHGIHFCLGAPLARLEARIVLGMLIERFPTIHRVRNVPLELKTSFFIYGLNHVPMCW